MKPGDLVELCIGQHSISEPGVISIGKDDGTTGRDFPVGTLCIYLGPTQMTLRRGHSAAADVLIDNTTGWVWQDEISPAAGATAAAQ